MRAAVAARIPPFHHFIDMLYKHTAPFPRRKQGRKGSLITDY